MIKPELMKIFVTVSETGSFTTAASVLGLPKANVSTAIQKLESELKVRLLQRTTRKVTITGDGQIFLERCKDLLSDFEELQTLFLESGPELSGKIRVDMPVPIAKNVVLPSLSEFIDQYPRIQLELSSTDRKVDLVTEGFDFVIRAGSLGDSSLIAKKIGSYSIVNCVSPEYLKRYGNPKNIEDLSKHFQIHYSQTLGGKPDGFEYYDGNKFVTVKTKSLITVNNTEAYHAACLAGLGIIQAPLSGVEDDLKTGKLKKILTKYESETFPISIVYPNRRHVSKRVRVFMDWIENRIKGYIR